MFKLFGQSKNKCISLYDFLKGVGRATKSSFEDRIKLFFSLYDIDNKGYLTDADVTRMLLNYPVADLNNITDGAIKEVKENKVRLRRGSAQLQINNSALDDSKVESVQEAKMSRSEDGNQLSRDDVILRKNSDGPSPSNASDQRPKLLPRKGSTDSIANYQVQCHSINSRIKNYVASLFAEYDPQQTGKFTFEAFRTWVGMHSNVIRHFEENFHASIWKSAGEQDILSFKNLAPEVNFYANLFTIKNNKRTKKERVWLQLHRKFFIILCSKDDQKPRRVVLLDGLNLSLPPKNPGDQGSLFVLDYTSEYYKPVYLEIEDDDSFQALVKKLSYLQE